MEKIKILGVALVLIFMGEGMVRAQEAAAAVGSAAKPAAEGEVQVTTYDELRRAISETRAASRKRVEQAVEQERVREAWEIGRLIDAHVLQHKERAGYDRQVLVRLAKDLGTSKTELYYMLEFARAYPIFPLTGKLSWSHYRDLLSVNDAKEREAIAEQAAQNKWTQKEVRQAVRKAKGVRKEDSGSEEQLLPSEPGKPGTYRVILAKAGPYAGKLALDLGFSNYVSLSSVTASPGKFKEGDIVTSSQDSKGGYKLLAIGSGSEFLLYTYNAYVYEVLDGDTIEAVVDLGFGFVTTQTLRLRGIDAPEIATADGMEAKQTLEKMLGMAEGVRSAATGEAPSRDTVPRTPCGEKILIKTVKSDKYDRYLADIFYPPPQKAGRSNPPSSVADMDYVYVNQKLVDEGLAINVEE
ncbi:MAG: DUF1016 N-terminal domain-containing protein [Candidatus Omnitrophota bacterium]